MIRIRVLSPEVREMQGVSKNTGKDYHLRMQTAYAYTVDEQGTVAELPDKFTMMLEKDQPAYAAGWYTIHPASLYVSYDGNLGMRLRLAPVKEPAKAAA